MLKDIEIDRVKRALVEWRQMLTSPSRRLSFDEFTLDIVRCVLLRGAVELPLRRQSFEVLRYLAEHAGKVVSSDELIEALWPVRPADQNGSVGQCIKEIRRAVGDDARWMIQTVSGRGYEFKAEVVPHQPSPPGVVASGSGSSLGNPEVGAQAWSPSSAQPTAIRKTDWLHSKVGSLEWRRKVLATVVLVLAFGATAWLLRPHSPALAPTSLTMMAAPTIAVLSFGGAASGLADELRSALTARARQGFGLTIKSTADVRVLAFMRKEDGLRLGARYAVLGTGSLDRDILHANIQLLELESNALTWSDSFDARLGEPGALEHLAARIARLITFHVAAVESRRPMPERAEAGHFVILGRALLDGERGSSRMREALTHFEMALSLDPTSIFALYGLAVIKINQVRNGWIPLEARPAALNQAETAIERIIRIDHRNAGAHWLRGFLLRERGDVDHAIAALEHALSLDPNYSLALAELGRTKVDAGRAREGLSNIEEAIRMSPTEPTIYGRYFWAGIAAVHLEDYQTAVKWLLKARQANRNYAITMQWLAVAYLGMGDEEKARAVISECLKVSPGLSIAAWNHSMSSRNPIVIEQRKRIADALRRLGVPEGRSAAAQR